MGRKKVLKLHIGRAEPYKKVQSIGSIRVDEISREDAKEFFEEHIDRIYDEYEEIHGGADDIDEDESTS